METQTSSISSTALGKRHRLLQYLWVIEKFFLIDDAKTGKLVPFKLRKVQLRYFRMLLKDYPDDRDPIREIILKARKEGFTSLILAIFAAACILSDDPIRLMEISYKADSTRQHFNRFCVYIESFCAYHGIDYKKFVSTTDNNEVVFNHNRATFFVGTASARTGERGGTVHGILFSEAAHYPDTENMAAAEIVEASSQQMDNESGMIFIETTANGFGNFFQLMWTQAEEGKIRHKPRFFGWREMYTPEQFEVIKAGFSDKGLIPQEYPETPMEAFVHSGRPVFDQSMLTRLYGAARDRQKKEPPMRGDLRAIAGKLVWQENPNGNLTIYQLPKKYHLYAIGADVADDGDFSTADVLDRETGETVAHWHGHIDPDLFGAELYKLGYYYQLDKENPAWIGVERNGLGIATLLYLKRKKYPRLYYQDIMDQRSNKKTRKFGWITSNVSKPIMISQMHESLRDGSFRPNSLEQLDEMRAYAYDKNGGMNCLTGHDDRVISAAIALQVHMRTSARKPVNKAIPPKSFESALKKVRKAKREEGRKNSLFGS